MSRKIHLPEYGVVAAAPEPKRVIVLSCVMVSFEHPEGCLDEKTFD